MPSPTEFTEEEIWDGFVLEARLYKDQLVAALLKDVTELMQKRAVEFLPQRGATAEQFAEMNPPEMITVLSEEVRITWKYFEAQAISVEAYTSIGTWELRMEF